MALIHLIFTLIKIAILASVYSIVMLLVLGLFEYIFRIKAIDILSKDKWFKVWRRFSLMIAFGLFIYSFTYWGNHGLGDESRIPIGHWNCIRNADGVSTYFEPKNKELGDQMDISVILTPLIGLIQRTDVKLTILPISIFS